MSADTARVLLDISWVFFSCRRRHGVGLPTEMENKSSQEIQKEKEETSEEIKQVLERVVLGMVQSGATP